MDRLDCGCGSAHARRCPCREETVRGADREGCGCPCREDCGRREPCDPCGRCERREPCDPCGRCEQRGRYLIPRVIGQGQTILRRARVRLCPDVCAPCGAQLIGVQAAGAPYHEELTCHERGAMLLRVAVPLTLRICADGCERDLPAETVQTLRIRLSCRREECWRHRVELRAVARLISPVCLSYDGCFDAALDLCIDGYLVADCVVGAQPDACPPPPRPLYPEPRGRAW